MKAKLIFALIFLICSMTVFGGTPGANLRILPNYEVQNAIEYDPYSDNSVRFRLRVPNDAFGIRFSLSGVEVDLDLVLVDEFDDYLEFSETSDFNEELFVSHLTMNDLESGTYYIEVYYPLSVEPKTQQGEILERIDFKLKYEVLKSSDFSELALGDSINAQLVYEEGMFKQYKINFSEEEMNQDYRIEVTKSIGDIDLYLQPRELIVNPFDTPVAAQSFLSKEYLDFHAIEEEYFLMVLSSMDEDPIDFQLELHPVDRIRPLDLPTLPQASTGINSLARATVELIGDVGGGSACLVAPEGYMISNYHVVRSSDGQPSENIYVAFSLDISQAPEELYKAEVIEYDELKDIALLKVVSDFYGNPIPADYKFPYFQLGEPNDLLLLEDLVFIGYPENGGLGTRSTLTITRGIVSGFEQRSFGRIVKTDGEINHGNSGGAALNADLKLIGMPTRIVGTDNGKLAYVYPVSLLPKSWRDRIGQ